MNDSWERSENFRANEMKLKVDHIKSLEDRVKKLEEANYEMKRKIVLSQILNDDTRKESINLDAAIQKALRDLQAIIENEKNDHEA